MGTVFSTLVSHDGHDENNKHNAKNQVSQESQEDRNLRSLGYLGCVPAEVFGRIMRRLDAESLVRLAGGYPEYREQILQSLDRLPRYCWTDDLLHFLSVFPEVCLPLEKEQGTVHEIGRESLLFDDRLETMHGGIQGDLSVMTSILSFDEEYEEKTARQAKVLMEIFRVRTRKYPKALTGVTISDDQGEELTLRYDGRAEGAFASHLHP